MNFCSCRKNHICRSCQSDVAYSYMYIFGDGANPSSKWRLYTKVRISNCIFGDRDRKQNFSTFHLRILEIQGLFSSSHHLTPRFANAIPVWAKTKIACNLPYIYVGLFSLVTTFQITTEELRFQAWLNLYINCIASNVSVELQVLHQAWPKHFRDSQQSNLFSFFVFLHKITLSNL